MLGNAGPAGLLAHRGIAHQIRPVKSHACAGVILPCKDIDRTAALQCYDPAKLPTCKRPLQNACAPEMRKLIEIRRCETIAQIELAEAPVGIAIGWILGSALVRGGEHITAR